MEKTMLKRQRKADTEDFHIIDTIIANRFALYKTMRRLYVIFVLAWVIGLDAAAQSDPHYSHYFFLEPSFNPAAVGKYQQLNVTGSYAISFLGFERNPRTMHIAADAPFVFINREHGAGAQLTSDQIGLFTHQRIALQYAYKQRLLGGVLSGGIQAALLSEGFDGSKLDIEDPTDPAFATSEVKGNSFDVAVGLYFHHKNWYAGLSAQHLTSPTILLGERNEINIKPTYYFTAGYNIRLRNPFLTIKPSVLLHSDGIAYRGDITARLVYTHDKQTLYGGIGYSPTNSVTAMIGGSFHGILLGYSYELYTNGIHPGNGSHELFIGYKTDLHFTKKGKNKHKSVRIL